jgi:hypothetical protein
VVFRICSGGDLQRRPTMRISPAGATSSPSAFFRVVTAVNPICRFAWVSGAFVPVTGVRSGPAGVAPVKLAKNVAFGAPVVASNSMSFAALSSVARAAAA